jgi:hypothetical protein
VCFFRSINLFSINRGNLAMLRKTASVAMFVGIAVLLVAGQAMALPVNSAITQDTSIYYHGPSGGWTDWNMGGWTIGGEPIVGVDARDAGSQDHVRALLAAGGIVGDLAAAGMTTSSQIGSAQLHLFIAVADRSTPPNMTVDRTVNAYRVTAGPWAQGSSVWATEPGAADGLNVNSGTQAWAAAGGDYDPTSLGTMIVPTAASPYTELTVTITDAVKHWVDNPSQNYGVMLIQDDAHEDDPRFFASSENVGNGGAYRPFITVTEAVPEPSTLALVATGLLGLLAYAWRKRK